MVGTREFSSSMARSRRRYYSDDDIERGVTPSDLKRMGRDRQKEYMRHWFHQNFEDPANETPCNSREGGYLYIWGGPYSAHEQLFDEFGSYLKRASRKRQTRSKAKTESTIGLRRQLIQTSASVRRSGERSSTKGLRRTMKRGNLKGWKISLSGSSPELSRLTETASRLNSAVQFRSDWRNYAYRLRG
jgi:hypothetical protein